MARRSSGKKPSLIRGIVLVYLGFNLLMTGGIMTMILGAVILGLGVAQLVAVATGGKKDREEKASPFSPAPAPRQTRIKAESFIRSEPEEPLRPRDMSRRDKDLEQLKSLYSAGLYTKEEYDQKRRKILSGQ